MSNPIRLDIGITRKARPFWDELCRQMEANDFFPCKDNPYFYTDTDYLTDDECEQLCYGCPLIKACYDFAVTNGELYGVWGGINMGAREDELF